MAKKVSASKMGSPSGGNSKKGAIESATGELQRPAAEILYADELGRLAKETASLPKPPGWKVTPQAVLDFVLGNEAKGIGPKFVGRRSFMERCVVSLATNRGLMLIGEPGTAKSYLSELLAAAISGDSTLTIQGSAGTTEDNIRYSWNYALLVSDGPSERSLVPAPLYTGMKLGKLVRFEEITRCPLEIQDVLLSVLSDRVMAIPEMDSEGKSLFARSGFNIIATANTRDRGVNEMSAALKRRFNFETVHPIAEIRE
ncbi:MAG: AAA family ATPase, partial [Planctomycetaceae bacterium]|nr:AAA family ATPase [Planctomycetaceae bacterium]